MEKNENKLSNKQIFYIIFLIVFLSSIFYISWIVWVLSTIFSLIFYSLIAYLIYFIWKSIFWKKYLLYTEFLNYFLYKISLSILIIILIIWGFSYYSNKINPAKMPTYTISNWDKTVIFQAMSHIWSKNFYENIKQNLIKAKKDWYVYFYEWVRDWNKKNKQDFNKAIWIKFDKDLYKNFSKLYWVINQDNSIYLNLVNNLDFNIDLSIDEIMNYYNNSKIENKKNILQNEEVIDVNTEIIKTLSSLNEKELKILRYINQSLLNFMIWSEKTQNLITNNFWNQKLFNVILNNRNENLSKNIIKSKYKKIYITYWLLHFRWVLENLKNNNKNWKIINKKILYPINKGLKKL